MKSLQPVAEPKRGGRRAAPLGSASMTALALVLAACGGTSDETSDDVPEVAQSPEVAGDDDSTTSLAATTTTLTTTPVTTTTTLPPIGTPFVVGEVLVVPGISELVGDGTLGVTLSTEPGQIELDVDGSVDVVDGRTCHFCMGTIELGPGAVAATSMLHDTDAQGTRVDMTVGVRGPMFPDDATEFIVAGGDGAVLEKVGAGYRLVEGEAWLVTDRSLIDPDAEVAAEPADESDASAAEAPTASSTPDTVPPTTSNEPSVREGVLYVATGFEDGGFSADVWVSEDARTWERVDTGLPSGLRDIAWNGRHWLAVGDALVATSADGRTWTARLDSPDYRGIAVFTAAAWGGEQWTVVGDFQIIANESSEWTGEMRGATEQGMVLLDIASNGDQWVTVGNGWQVLSYESPTGTAFAPRHGAPQDFENDPSIDDVLWDVAWGDGRWVAVGDEGRILVSTDGIGWSDVESGTNELLRAVAHDGSGWIAGSILGNVFTSADGLEWERTPGRPDTNELTDIVWDGCHWVLTGDGVHTSADGASWVRHDVDVLSTGLAVAYDPAVPCS